MGRVLLVLLVACPALLMAEATRTAWATATVLSGGGPHSYSATTGKVYVQAYNDVTDKFAIYETDLVGTSPVNKTSGVYAMDDDYGIPQVSPDGAWLLALRHDTTLTGTGCDTAAEWQPGQGVCNDLVIIKLSDGTLTVLVEGTDIPGTAEKFSWPQWSADQTMIQWTQYNTSFATIRTATINLSGTPFLSNTQSYAPAEADGFYETWGWLDGNIKREILFACLCEVGDVANDIDLATFNTMTGVMTRLTNTNERLEEHATPDPYGRDLILYTDNIDSTGGFFEWDFYTMREDGSGKQRVTYFNDANMPQFLSTASGYVTVANPVWVSQTTFLTHRTTDWTYPGTGNLLLMGFGDVVRSQRAGHGVRVRGVVQ